MKIALVIPVYNEEDIIKSVIKNAYKFIRNIYVVNDASTDNTKKILSILRIKIVQNKKNQGYTKTLEIGIRRAFNDGADYVITFDGDGQHSANDLENIIYVIEKKTPDLIIGKRSMKNRFMEEVFGIYSKLRFGFSDPLCGVKAYKKTLFYKYGKSLETKHTIATEIIFRAIKDGVKYYEVPIKINKRINESRFGNQLKGNLLELRAFFNILFI